MSVEITRPNLFPECPDCPIVNETINRWSTFKPTMLHHVSTKTESVNIECEVKAGYVFLLEKSLMKIKFIKGKRILPIEGGNITPEPVPCPHFKNPSFRSGFESEPE